MEPNGNVIYSAHTNAYETGEEGVDAIAPTHRRLASWAIEQNCRVEIKLRSSTLAVPHEIARFSVADAHVFRQIFLALGTEIETPNARLLAFRAEDWIKPFPLEIAHQWQWRDDLLRRARLLRIENNAFNIITISKHWTYYTDM